MTTAESASTSRSSTSPSITGEPIAIVGMACRFPGAGDLDSFWRLLMEGGNSVTEGVPGSGTGRLAEIIRDPSVLNEACRFGAFVEDIDRFDASFFRISPVEAELLDPQQRMMLETSWQALEDAGIDPNRLAGSRTGVYTGISNDEYRMLVLDTSRPKEAAGSLYALSGTNLNGTSGRVSFVLGLMGPAKAVDAACASALVAVHDAVSDLQQGRADLAIAGGVQAILNGRVYELRAEAMMLSPDGQCKTFDASANGYVRGEGCGVVVLKRLSDAEADGDPIWAVIKGTAVNNGGTSQGLTVPHTPALEQVMETALEDAGVHPSDVDFLEAHGTGTAVGDPIELDAVATIYGKGREAAHPLLIGSVKTNIGHLESAAGIAGLIKAALTLKRGVIPKHLHFEDPNPSFDWDHQPLVVTSKMMDWPHNSGRPRLAGVNSFGITGTNAHLIVQEHPGPSSQSDNGQYPNGSQQKVAIPLTADAAKESSSEAQVDARTSRLLPLSAKSRTALKDLASGYLSWLGDRNTGHSKDSESLLPDMSWSAGIGRCHFEHRAGLAFEDVAALRQKLTELAEDDSDVEPRAATKVAFAYTGQGSQWIGMGRSLYESEPVARAVFDRCEDVFQQARGESLLAVMFGKAGAEGDLGDTAWEQPALYALECALTAMWASVGVVPSVVLGHSVGELAAAQAAGVFSLEDGMRFAAARGTLLSGTSPGAMAAIFAPADSVTAEVEAHNSSSSGVGLSIAADNGAHIVVSGPSDGIDAIVRRFESLEVRARRLNTTRAFHSALVEPALDGLETTLAEIAVGRPSLTVVSNVTGQPVDANTTLDTHYWKRHAREPVAFAGGVSALADLGVDLVIEIGPHAVLGPMATLAWPDPSQAHGGSTAPAVIASLRRPPRDGSSQEPESTFVDAVGQAYEAGLDISFEGLFAGETRCRVTLPGYPFQRERYWVSTHAPRRAEVGHTLLGVRHESARGEVTFETEVLPSDPPWLSDHKVFGRLVAPGALYGSMAAAATLNEGGGSIVMADGQLHNALVFGESEEDADGQGRVVQVVLDPPEQGTSRRVQIYSRGLENEWTLHVEGRLLRDGAATSSGDRVDLESLKARLSPADVPAYYRAKSATGIDLGPSFRTLGNVWAGPGEALGEVRLPADFNRHQLDVHPLVLDGCFQVVGMARNMSGAPGEPTYLPFGWERMWLADGLPNSVVCHVQMNELAQDQDPAQPSEVLTGELRIYSPDGSLLGELNGYAVKRATRAALLSSFEGIDDLLYEVIWKERPLPPGIDSAAFFPNPGAVYAQAQLFPSYLTDAGVDPDGRNRLLADLERWSRSRALTTLEDLGWTRVAGETIDPGALRERLGVVEEHSRLFRRMLEMLARSEVLEESDDGFLVRLGPDDPLPEELPPDLEAFAASMTEWYPHGLTEIGLFKRSGEALADVLQGNAAPLTLLFSSGEPTAADLYLKAPVARAANRMLSEAVRNLVDALPVGRRLRVIEIGAGTGSATASVLPELPDGQFDYVYTDISAGFFAEAESRFGTADGSIDYRPLDIEKNPVDQGFDAHGYDLIIASNVLHATRRLDETLANCLALLAPSGHMVALENLRGLGWMDLTFGQLDGWWRFEDPCRPDHALATPTIWRQALSDAGFTETEVLGVDDSFSFGELDKGVIVTQGPEKVAEPAGAWVLTSDRTGAADELAQLLTARNQTVILVGEHSEEVHTQDGDVIHHRATHLGSRESWRSLFEDLPVDVPFSGVVHLQALAGHGAQADAPGIAEDVTRIGSTALSMLQGLSESGAIPEKGMWLLTRGAQILERENGGQLSGAILWGLGKVASLEASHLHPRMIDLDPSGDSDLSSLVNELMYPDDEDHIALRAGRRRAARLDRLNATSTRLALPEETDWALAPDRNGVFETPEVKPLPPRSLEPKDVLVAVEATGLNFWDVFRSLGFIEEGDLGREMCGRIVDVGPDVSAVSIGDRVVGLGFGAFAAEMVTREELVAPAPEGLSVSDLATIPSAFVSAELSYRLSGLNPGDRVLIHAGSGGVGLAAIQLAQAAGAEVFATASAPKQAYLRSVGVEHIYDSRQTDFGSEILEATGGEGVHVVLNSLTSEGFIDASLSCLAQGGRFIELARRDILSEEVMAELRPDVTYAILELDVLKKTEPEMVGEVLRDIMARVAAGELRPIIHSRWPLAEAGAALSFMRSARHIGKIVLTPSPISTGELRQDRTYLVTGGLGGIGCAVAGWLADHGAGSIVLNGRRDPDAEAQETIAALRERGVNIEVELADVTDSDAVDAMLARIESRMPPLGGVVHSVGVLSDAALVNQTWESFERVLWPKIIGAWHLHRATVHHDLDLFILFSSRVGVMGNPGQSNHAAANAFLDQLAVHRRALGLPGQAIAWGAWSDIGEAAEQRERIEERRAALGGRWFTPKQGIDALERLVRQDTATSVVMSMDWAVFAEAVENRPPLLEEMLSSTDTAESDDSATPQDLLSQLRSASAERGDALVSFLQGEIQAVLRLPNAPAITVGFFDLGMDSLMAVELRNRLNRAFSGEFVVSNTAVFDYPNITALAAHLAEELSTSLGDAPAEAAPTPVAAPEPQPERATTTEDAIAIVGMACRFPGAPDLDSFWRLLESGTDAVSDGRAEGDHWHGVVGDPKAEDAIYRKGGFVDGIDQFDNRFFRISPIEARMMDPQQRMLLETTWQALEDAGIGPESIRGSRTGIYAGIGSSEYRDVIAASGQEDLYFGTSGSMGAGRIAFVLGLEGPAMPVDMACASSLAAVHYASAALQRGEVDMALAGGVNAVLSQPIMRFHRDLGMLSAQGLCNAFDASADGFVRSDGCGMIVLKRLSDAEADGDRIWGIVRGSAINQNGASAGLPVPNGPAQERLIADALARAGVSPADIDYLEAHGAGTDLGDSIELRALAAVYGQGRESGRPLLMGSVKTNIGHSEWAAGMASIIKAIMAMDREVIPAHLHFQSPNPNFDWDGMSVQVTSEPTAWPDNSERPPLAAVNSFGLSGTNAHVVLEGYRSPDSQVGSLNGTAWPAGASALLDVTPPPGLDSVSDTAEECAARSVRLLPLSGKSPDALRELAGRYLSWLDGHVLEHSDGLSMPSLLSDMAWTAAIGRNHFDHRSGIVFQDESDLRAGLAALAESGDGTSAPDSDGAQSVAFVFAGGAADSARATESLYNTEPVFWAVLDHCDRLVQQMRGASLLDAMFERPGTTATFDDHDWENAATYTLNVAFAALWDSVGVQPARVLGQGVGELAAAQAAGVFGLDEGLRLAMSLSDPEAALSSITLAPTVRTLISGVTGQVLRSSDELTGEYWGRLTTTEADLRGGVATLAEVGADVVVEIGSRSGSQPIVAPCWPKLTDDSPVPAFVDGGLSDNGQEGFVRAVAAAYEAGIPISFPGLFAGEARRKISIPGYPFQRRSFWVQPRSTRQ